MAAAVSVVVCGNLASTTLGDAGWRLGITIALDSCCA